MCSKKPTPISNSSTHTIFLRFHSRPSSNPSITSLASLRDPTPATQGGLASKKYWTHRSRCIGHFIILLEGWPLGAPLQGPGKGKKRLASEIGCSLKPLFGNKRKMFRRSRGILCAQDAQPAIRRLLALLVLVE